MNDTYNRLRRLAALHADIEMAGMQLEFDLQQVWPRYEPRAVAPTAGNLALPAFLQIQAD